MKSQQPKILLGANFRRGVQVVDIKQYLAILERWDGEHFGRFVILRVWQDYFFTQKATNVFVYTPSIEEKTKYLRCDCRICKNSQAVATSVATLTAG